MWIGITAGVDLIKITAGRLISLPRCNADNLWLRQKSAIEQPSPFDG